MSIDRDKIIKAVELLTFLHEFNKHNSNSLDMYDKFKEKYNYNDKNLSEIIESIKNDLMN